uniref:E2F transcription factor 5 n=1 Tax=Periophthalmus magnuspinnatus TaxID=409849 RepID=A0A3B4A4U5_9GOBI
MKTSVMPSLEVPLPEMGLSGQKKYQVNLRSHTAPIQVMLINRDCDGSAPVVFSVPPTDELCPMPTPPHTPASLQRFPLSSQASFSYCSQDSLSAVDLIDELMSSDGMDYSFNLDEHEGVCDLFDVQILNY